MKTPPTVAIAPRLSWRVIERKAYIFDPASSTLHELNETATMMWEALEKKADTDALARTLCAQFDIDAKQAERDIIAFIDDIRAKDLLA